MIFHEITISDKKELNNEYNKIDILSDVFLNMIYDDKKYEQIKRNKYIINNNSIIISYDSKKSLEKAFVNLRNSLLSINGEYKLNSLKFYIEKKDINKILWCEIKDFINKIFSNTNAEFIIYSVKK